MRWQAERWMKVRHLPAAFRHDPRFVLRNGRRMLAPHVPRHRRGDRRWGSRASARRSRATARSARGERDYVDWPDPHPPSSDLDTREAGAPAHLAVLRAG